MNRTRPNGNLHQPPWFIATVLAPCAPSQFASSNVVMIGAPVLFEIATESPTWSLWPWVKQNIGGIHLIGWNRSLRIASQEWIEQKLIRPGFEISGRMAEKGEFHRICL